MGSSQPDAATAADNDGLANPLPAETKDDVTARPGTPPAPVTSVSTSAENGTGASPKFIDINKSKSENFEGQVSTSNELPSAETITKIENYIVLDKDGKSKAFKSLYSGSNVARRVLVVFIRHFFCGNCQEYLRTLSESVTPEALLHLPISTFVVVVGCGDPALINMYIEATNCPFPIYTDPTRSLFDELGMSKTLALGVRPAYMQKSLWKSLLGSVGQALRFVPKGLAHKSGDQRQVGGEFLFEPLDLVSPIWTPQEEQFNLVEAPHDAGRGGKNRDDDVPVEPKWVTWCHRMKTTRDHAEIPELMDVLGLAGHGEPIQDRKRWSKALESRKGTGMSMASEMRKLSESR